MSDAVSELSLSPEKKPLTEKTKRIMISAYRKVSQRYQFLSTGALIAEVKKRLRIDLNEITEEEGQQILKGIWVGIRKQGVWGG